MPRTPKTPPPPAPSKAANRPELNQDQIQAVGLGFALRDFLGTPAGAWLLTRLTLGMKDIALEGLLDPQEGRTIEFYRGRAYELTQVTGDINAMIGRAQELQESVDGEQVDDRVSGEVWDAIGGPGLGSGAGSAFGRAGDFGDDT